VALLLLEANERARTRLDGLTAGLDLDVPVHDHQVRVLVDLVVAQLLPRIDTDQNGARLVGRMQDDRAACTARRGQLGKVPALHSADPIPGRAAVRLAATMAPVVDTYALGPTQTNCYVVRADTGAREAVVVDPGYEGFEPGFDVAAILITHTHYDHVGAVAELAERTRAPVHVPTEERAVLARADEIYGGFGVEVRPWAGEVVEVSGGDQLELGGVAFETVGVPGHSPGHVAYFSEPYLFSGDVLFAGSVGRVDLPGGDWEQLYESIQHLITRYDPETIVLSGHGPPTTLGAELAGNPFLTELRAAP
jgi:hydroxyacylglutathione hydrolase